MSGAPCRGVRSEIWLHLRKPAVAVNADNPFPVGMVPGVSLPAASVSLRELTRQLAAADKKSLVVQSKPDAEPHYLLFERLAFPDGRAGHVVVAYDGTRKGDLESIADLLRGQLLKRLREHGGNG